MIKNFLDWCFLTKLVDYGGLWPIWLCKYLTEHKVELEWVDCMSDCCGKRCRCGSMLRVMIK
jgi:hypothetical protein